MGEQLHERLAQTESRDEVGNPYIRVLGVISGAVDELERVSSEIAKILEDQRWRLSKRAKADLALIHDRLTDAATALRKELDRPILDRITTKHHLGIAKRALQMLRAPAISAALLTGLGTGIATPPGIAIANRLFDEATTTEEHIDDCQVQIETLVLDLTGGGSLADPDDSGSIETDNPVAGDAGPNEGSGTTVPTLSAIRDLLPATLDLIDRAYEHGGLAGRATGFRDLDARLLGLQSQHLYALVARTGMGASAFAFGIASNLAFHDRVPTVLVPLDHTQQDVSLRLLSSEALIDHGGLRSGGLEEPAWNRLAHAVGRLAEAPIYVKRTDNLVEDDVRTMLNEVRTSEGLVGALIVDGLPSGSRWPSGLRPAFLKRVAVEFDIPVLLTARLSKSLERRVDRRPLLTDLDDSLEQSADVIIGLYRDDVCDDLSMNRGVDEFIVMKNRNGGTGRIYLAYRPQYVRFDSLARPDDLAVGELHQS